MAKDNPQVHFLLVSVPNDRGDGRAMSKKYEIAGQPNVSALVDPVPRGTDHIKQLAAFPLKWISDNVDFQRRRFALRVELRRNSFSSASTISSRQQFRVVALTRLSVRCGLWLALLAEFSGCAFYHSLPLTGDAVANALRKPQWTTLQVQASEIKHPLLAPIRLNPRAGLTPDGAAVIAVLINPSLRATRDRRQIATAELFQAGILPNPQVTGSLDFVTGGTIVPGLLTGYGVGVSWDIQALIQLAAKKAAARAGVESIDLDIAWTEWQIAQAAKLAVYRVVSDEAQLARANDVDSRLSQNLETMRQAVSAHAKTELDLATAESARQDAHAIVLVLAQDLAHQKLALKKALGVPADTVIRLNQNIALPSHVSTPSLAQLMEGIEERRLDLRALKKGYESQEEKVRAAILAQFPKIGIGFNPASDTSNVHTIGPAVTVDLPIFDRGQGSIAFERATRQKLYDEYINRVFEGRSDVATALTDIRSLEEQIAAAETALPILQHLVDVYGTAINQGNTDAFSYYSAQNNLNQKTIQILKLKQQLIETRIALELAAGRYFLAPNTRGSR